MVYMPLWQSGHEEMAVGTWIGDHTGHTFQLDQEGYDGEYGLGRVAGNSEPKPQVDRVAQPGTRP